MRRTKLMAGMQGGGEEYAITKAKNAAVMAVMYAKGACANEDYMTFEEAAAHTNQMYNWFVGNTAITSFDELQYFTGITKLGGFTFQNCSNLVSIKLPPNLIALNGSTFRGCSSLLGLDFPESFSSAKYRDICDAYTGSNVNMTLIFRSAAPPSLASGAISGLKGNIYVPDAAVETYKAASVFSDFADQILPISQMGGGSKHLIINDLCGFFAERRAA